MSHLWFPVTQDTLSKGANPGHWQGHSAQALGELASELSYDGVAKRINSLPTPWSRAVQIGQAITNSHYPTRGELLDELFGCLAVVGLSGLYNLNLRSDILNLEELCDDREPSVRRFAASLRENKPEGSQSVLEELPEGVSPWDSLIVFTIHNDRTHQSQPIGFTSPSSILCPTTQLRHEIAGVAWSRGGRFSDPTPHLSLRQHKQPLANWLHQLHQDILNYKPAEPEQKDALCGVLKEFIGRLKVNPSTAPETGKRIPKVSNTRFRFLAHAAAPVKSEGNCCRVILKDKLAGDRKPVILVDPHMHRRLQKMASEIQLYGPDTLETIGGDAQSLRDRHKDINVVTPDDLFLPNLTLLPGGHALCHSWLSEILTARLEVGDQEDTTPLLPFSSRLQELFSSGELKEMVRLAVDHSQGCLVVELALKLEGFEEKYRLERSYPLKDATVLCSIPVMAIWPSIPADHWHQYWIFSQMVDGLSIDKTASWEGPHLVESGGDQVRYFCSTSFPDLLNVSVNGEPGGLIPLESPEPISVTGERWNVGLDFGTSFTNWAIWDENQAPRRLPLQSALWPVTVANDQVQREFLNRYFLPQEMYPADNNPPTSTSLSVVGCDPKKLDSKDIPGLFHEARLHIPQPGETFRSHLRTGFKWEHPEFQEPFLQQLALMISAHAVRAGVSKMTWSLSYPTAFPTNTKRKYERFWKNLTRETLKNISEPLDHELRKDRPLLSEAVAFACCLAEDSNNIFQHTACMDIGGRTTDISLWQKSRLIHQVSVPFAGQHICTKILDFRPEFASRLLGKSLTFMQRSSGQTMESNRLSLIDNYIRFESEALLQNTLPRRRSQKQSEKDKTLEQFISLMALATGGLYHYLGFVVRCLYENKTLERESCVSVYVGGNGGKLLHWLDPTCQFNQDSQVNRWLSRIQASAINLNDNEPAEETRLSEKFKDEVATGLVVNQPHLSGLSDDDSKYKPFSGESLHISGYDFAAEQPIDLSKFDHDEPVESMKLLDLKELQRYVRGMVKAMEGLRDDLQLDPVVQASDLEGVLGEKVLDRAQNLCDQHLGDCKTPKTMGNFSVEPGFFLGLRALVEVLADDWAADRL